jgi:hypothetical protein
MSEIDNGGWAFPSGDAVYPNGQIQYGHYGMSLRDWFAGQALAVLLADPKNNSTFDYYAKTAYKIADEMIEHRKEQQP